MSSLLLLNGSPRGESGNTPRLLNQVGLGWVEACGGEVQMLNIAKRTEFASAVEAFGNRETVLLGMPLYTDAMPGLVKEYIEALSPYVGREDNPKIGFLVQSGFSEALHSRHLERYLEKLASRLGCEYAGTIVSPNGEGIRLKPDSWNRKPFGRCRALGASLADEGRFDPGLLKTTAGTERYSAPMATLVSVVNRTPLGSWYWDSQLKKNGAYEDRFATPYA